MYEKPFTVFCNFENGVLAPAGEVIVRNLSDMQGFYQDEDAFNELLTENPKIYEYYNVLVPKEPGHLQHCTSILLPGRVGKEYFMSKGHFHEILDTAEIYITYRGKGILLVQTLEGHCESLRMYPGSMSYIPPYWAHRTVNIGDEPLIFFGVYRGDAGHNYSIIEESGFAEIVVEQGGGPAVIDNVKYKKQPG